MTVEEMIEFIEAKIVRYSERIIRHSDRIDEAALGQLVFYMSLRRVLKKQGTPQDMGMMDAVNDSLQEMGILDQKSTFLEFLG